jgi:hypothetical protein
MKKTNRIEEGSGVDNSTIAALKIQRTKAEREIARLRQILARHHIDPDDDHFLSGRH